MTLEQLPLIMIRALALTIVIECCAAWVLGLRNGRDQLVVVLANLLTNPLVVSLGAAAAYFIGYRALLPVTLALEVLTVLAEGLVYKKTVVMKRDPFVFSLLCNLCSYVIGEFLNRLVF